MQVARAVILGPAPQGMASADQGRSIRQLAIERAQSGEFTAIGLWTEIPAEIDLKQGWPFRFVIVVSQWLGDGTKKALYEKYG